MKTTKVERNAATIIARSSELQMLTENVQTKALQNTIDPTLIGIGFRLSWSTQTPSINSYRTPTFSLFFEYFTVDCGIFRKRNYQRGGRVRRLAVDLRRAKLANIITPSCSVRAKHTPPYYYYCHYYYCYYHYCRCGVCKREKETRNKNKKERNTSPFNVTAAAGGAKGSSCAPSLALESRRTVHIVTCVYLICVRPVKYNIHLF